MKIKPGQILLGDFGEFVKFIKRSKAAKGMIIVKPLWGHPQYGISLIPYAHGRYKRVPKWRLFYKLWRRWRRACRQAPTH